MKQGLDDWFLKQSGDKKQAFETYAKRIDLAHQNLTRATRWFQRWRRKQAEREADQGVLVYRRADSIEMRPIRWCWKNRFAFGKSALIAGHPGLAKTQVVVSMAAIVTTGGTFPMEETPCEAGNVVILSAEDGAEDTLVPRLQAAGADLSRIYIIDAVTQSPLVDGTRVFDLKRDLGKLGDMIQKIGGAALVMIDPISAYLGGTDSHKNAEVRSLLTPLAAFAEQHEVAIVSISHFNKSLQGEAILRITGSLAFVAAARSAYVVVQDPENEARRLFLPLKNNLGADQGGLAFTVESVQLESPKGLIETSHVLWEAEVVTTTANEAMRPQDNPEERSELTDAKDFLRELLTKNAMSPIEIQAVAKEAGISWRSIERAKAALMVRSKKGGMKKGWSWHLSPPPTSKERQKSPKCPPSESSGSSRPSGGIGGLQEGITETAAPEGRQKSSKTAKNAKNCGTAPSGGVVGDLQGNGTLSLEPHPPGTNGTGPQDLEGGKVLLETGGPLTAQLLLTPDPNTLVIIDED